MRFSFLAAAACSSAIILSGATYVSWSTRTPVASQTAYFEAVLRDARVSDHVTLDGITYRIRNGEVVAPEEIDDSHELSALRLAYAKTLAQRSAPFSLAGTSLMHLDIAIKNLARVQDDLATLQASARERRAVASALYPLRFLSAISETERLRKAFIETGTDDDWHAYRISLDKTLEAHHRDAYVFLRAFEDIVPLTTKRYGTARTIIDRKSSVAALHALLQRGEGISARLRALDRCMTGVVDACEQGAVEPPQIPAIPQMRYTAQNDAQALKARAFYTDLGFIVDSMPRVVLAESICVHPDRTPPVFTLSPQTSLYGHLERFGIVPLGNIRFLSPEQRTGIPYLDFFLAKGNLYVPGKEMNQYNCPQIDRDVGTLFSLYGLRWAAQENDLASFASPEDKAELARISQALSGDTLLESDANAFARIAQHVLASSTVPAPIADPLYDVLAGYRDRSAGFDWIPTEIARIESRNLFALGNGAHPELSTAFLFFARSGIYALLMAENRSLGLSGVIFDDKPSILPQEPFRYFSDFADDAEERSRALSDMQEYLRLHDELL